VAEFLQKETDRIQIKRSKVTLCEIWRKKEKKRRVGKKGAKMRQLQEETVKKSFMIQLFRTHSRFQGGIYWARGD
jgi:hypothetical protein